MLKNDISSLHEITMQAEREFASFLLAAPCVFRQTDEAQIGEIWLRTLDSLDWPTANHEKFFHRVTVMASVQLAQMKGVLTLVSPAFERGTSDDLKVAHANV